MASCECNIAGLLGTNYDGIISANMNGSTVVEVSESGLVMIGQTINTLSITAYAFLPGGDMFLGTTCPASVSASVEWVQKYDCITDTVYFIPKSGGKVSMVGGPLRNVSMLCDPNIISRFYDANATSGPTTPVITSNRSDGFGIRYTGNPISIDTLQPSTYNIRIGTDSIDGYLQSFSLSISPPSPATVSYAFVFSG